MTPELSSDEVCTYLLQVISSIMKDKLEGGSSFNKEYVTGKIRVVREYVDSANGKVTGVEIWERADTLDANRALKDMWELKAMDNRTKAVLEDFRKRHPNIRILESMPDGADESLGTITPVENSTPLEQEETIAEVGTSERVDDLQETAIPEVQTEVETASEISQSVATDKSAFEDNSAEATTEEIVEKDSEESEEPDSYVAPRREEENSEPSIADLMAIEEEGKREKPRIVMKPPEFTRPTRADRQSAGIDMDKLTETSVLPVMKSKSIEAEHTDIKSENAPIPVVTATVRAEDGRRAKPYVEREIAASSHPYAHHVNYTPSFTSIKGKLESQSMYALLYAYFDYCTLGGVNFGRRWGTAYASAYQKFNTLKKWISGFNESQQEEYDKVKEAYLSVYGEVMEK